MPGAYRTWVPSEGKLVTSSEVLFDELHFPWRPSSDSSHLSVPQSPPHCESHQSSGLPATGFPADPAERPATSTIASAWAAATRRGALTARDSKHVLILFSGPYRRPDGLAAFLRQQGLHVTLLDNDKTHGNAADDITDDKVFEDILLRIKNGHYLAIFAAPPCSTFSISRFFESLDAEDGGPPIVRTRDEPEGLNDTPEDHKAELVRANLIVQRTCALLAAGYEAGTQYILEHPSDRGNPAEKRLILAQGPRPYLGHRSRPATA